MSLMLEIDNIRVGYQTRSGQRVVVQDLSLSLAPGEIGCLLGTSGCGKTTALRAVPDSNRFRVDASFWMARPSLPSTRHFRRNVDASA